MSALMMTSSERPKTLTDFSIDTIIGQEKQQTSDIPTTHNEHLSSLPIDAKKAFSDSPTSRKSRPKNFQCPACKMAFSNNGQLKNHVRIHTGERPFRCNHTNCNKTFTRNEELTRHKLIHTGVRPHACITCGKCFGRKDHLKKHIRTHDKKRLRKRVFVNTHPSAFIDRNVFVRPKSTTISQVQEMKFPSVTTNANMNPTSLTTHTSFTLQHPHHQTMTSSATSTIQQLANEYWNKWYNMIGIYQQQSCSQINALSNIFKRP